MRVCVNVCACDARRRLSKERGNEAKKKSCRCLRHPFSLFVYVFDPHVLPPYFSVDIPASALACYVSLVGCSLFGLVFDVEFAVFVCLKSGVRR